MIRVLGLSVAVAALGAFGTLFQLGRAAKQQA